MPPEEKITMPVFPEGKIRPDDEGLANIAIAGDTQRGVVHIRFFKPMEWIALEPEHVDQLIAILEKNKQKVLAARKDRRPS